MQRALGFARVHSRVRGLAFKEIAGKAEAGVRQMRRPIIIIVGSVLTLTFLWLVYAVSRLQGPVAKIGPAMESLKSVQPAVDSLSQSASSISAQLRAIDFSSVIVSEDLHQLGKRQVLLAQGLVQLAESLRRRNAVAAFEGEFSRTPVDVSTPLASPLPERFRSQVRIGPSPTTPGAIALTIDAPELVGKKVPVLAAQHGWIVRSEPVTTKSGVTWIVGIRNRGRYGTYYAHLTESTVRPGQEVERGDRIGLVEANSPLCLKMWMVRPGSDVPLDPSALLPRLGSVEGQAEKN